jgi:hypothetical protein
MRKASMLVAVMVVAAAGCGGNNVGFYARGSLRATVTQPGVAMPTETGFNFDDSYRVDPSIAVSTPGFTGACQIGPTNRVVRLTRVGGDDLGMREVQITMPPWEDTGTTCPRSTISITIGPTTFQGQEACGGAPGTCTFTATRRGSYGMDLNVRCLQLRASGDTRTVDFTGALNLDECDGPETRNTR